MARDLNYPFFNLGDGEHRNESRICWIKQALKK
jgi:hypothetical protein